MNLIPFGATFYVPLDEFGSVSLAAQFRSLSSFVILPFRTIRSFADMVQERADYTSNIILQHSSCSTSRWEMSLRLMKILATKFAAMDREPLWNASIRDAPLNFDRSFVRRSLFAATFVVAFPCQA